MKTMALEQADHRIVEALKLQRRDEPILLTEGSEAVALLLKLPEGMKDRSVDHILWHEGPEGISLVMIEAKDTSGRERNPPCPVFGSCQGMLTVVSEDDEHLKDFEDYMR